MLKHKKHGKTFENSREDLGITSCKMLPRKISEAAMSKKCYYHPVRPEGSHPNSQGAFSSLIIRSTCQGSLILDVHTKSAGTH